MPGGTGTGPNVLHPSSPLPPEVLSIVLVALREAADDDAQLLEKVRAHAAEAHPELTEEQIQQVMAQGAHDSH